MADFRTPSPHSPVHSQLLQQQQHEANPMQLPPPTSTAIIPSTHPSPPSSGVSNRKRRGRPRGSKNKPKTPIYITPQLPGEPTVKLLHLCIPAGNDVVDVLKKFARSKRVGLHVLNGSGSVSGFTLREPPVAPSGVFNLVSLCGTFVDSSVAGPWLTIFVSGNAGAVHSGTVISKVLAVTDVSVNVILFNSGGEYCYRLEPGMLVRMDQNGYTTVPSCTGGAVGGGAIPLSAPRFGVPTQHLNWASPAVTAQPLNRHFQGRFNN